MEQTVDIAELPWQEFYKNFYQGKSKKCLTPDDFSEEEYDFYRLYLEQCKRADSGANWFDFTIMDYTFDASKVDGSRLDQMLNPKEVPMNSFIF